MPTPPTPPTPPVKHEKANNYPPFDCLCISWSWATGSRNTLVVMVLSCVSLIDTLLDQSVNPNFGILWVTTGLAIGSDIPHGFSLAWDLSLPRSCHKRKSQFCRLVAYVACTDVNCHINEPIMKTYMPLRIPLFQQRFRDWEADIGSFDFFRCFTLFPLSSELWYCGFVCGILDLMPVRIWRGTITTEKRRVCLPSEVENMGNVRVIKVVLLTLGENKSADSFNCRFLRASNARKTKPA